MLRFTVMSQHSRITNVPVPMLVYWLADVFPRSAAVPVGMFLRNVISVFEPSYGPLVPQSRVEAIERSCYLLKLAMQTLCRTAFRDCSHEVTLADMRLLTFSDPSLSFWY